MADNADRAGDQQDMLMKALLANLPKPQQRTAPGKDCLSCGEEIPAERRRLLENCCLCVDCQEDAERAMGR
jgi:RNA polymerase-binding transcription factor DksA